MTKGYIAEKRHRSVKIKFPFNPLTVARMKTLPNQKWHDADKFWTATLCIQTVNQLTEWGFSFDAPLLDWYKKSVLFSPVKPINPTGLKDELFEFQKWGIGFIESRNGCALLADEMGLGKTIQALGWLQLHPELRPAVVICPASVKLNWKKEAKLWIRSPKTSTLSGRSGSDISGKADIIIINYDIITNKYKSKTIIDRDGKKIVKVVEIRWSGWKDYLSKIKPKVLILDEAHYIKNSKALRTKAVKSLARRIPHRIALTGTPIISRPIEMYNTIRLINPGVFSSRWDYALKYCDAKEGDYGWDLTGASNTKELHDKLVSTIMLRRKKSDVLKELPEKRRAVIPVEINNRREYNRAENDFKKWIREKDPEGAERRLTVEAMAKIEALKQLAIEGKMDLCLKWIADFLDSDEKLVVFATHKKTINAVMKKFKYQAVKVDGSVTGTNRQTAVEEFQTNDRVRLFVGNIKAAGIGITLTASSNACFLEYPWSPGDLLQAEDRIHRIGQIYAVTIWNMVAANTIDEDMLLRLQKKAEVVEGVTDGTELEEVNLFRDIIMNMSRR